VWTWPFLTCLLGGGTPIRLSKKILSRVNRPAFLCAQYSIPDAGAGCSWRAPMVHHGLPDAPVLV
jgi:hypothetical protein